MPGIQTVNHSRKRRRNKKERKKSKTWAKLVAIYISSEQSKKD